VGAGRRRRRHPVDPRAPPCRARDAAAAAHPRDRRRHGHDDPGLPAEGGRLPRYALRRLAARPAWTQRPADAHAACDHPRHPRGVSRCGRGRPRDQLLQLERPLARRLRHGAHGARAVGGLGAPGALGGGRLRGGHARAAPLRGRRPRPHQPHHLALARRERSRLPLGDLRRAGEGLHRVHRRPARWRRRPDPDRDDLRHAEREGRDLRRRRGLRASRRAGADHDLGDHHRRERPDALGPDHRGVLELGGACAPDHHRAQLRAGRQGPAPLRAGALAHRADLRQHASQCRPAERIRPVRRGTGIHGGAAARVRGGGLPEHGGGLLRHHAGPHPP